MTPHEPKAPARERIVIFALGEQRYALPIDRVQEIQQIVEPTPVPDTSSALLGMINLRGAVVPAIDLRQMLGMEPRTYDLQTPMVVCRSGENLVALVVDAVQDVIAIDADAIQPPSGVYELADRMIGVYRSEQGLVFVLDVESLLPEERLSEVGSLVDGEV